VLCNLGGLRDCYITLYGEEVLKMVVFAYVDGPILAAAIIRIRMI